MGKPIGIRTCCLICLGTYVFVAMSLTLSSNSMDPSRIVGQVITGIGFLGAGVMISRDGTVHGVTSASTIWMLAAIGVVVGLGYPGLGLKCAVLTIVVLVGVEAIERSFTSMQRGVHRRLKRGHMEES
jgi:putative Mg2+ transporter-C (MgtC) family protein